MARFTGGVASYMRRVNTGNYEHKEFKAEISWSADEGDTGAATVEMIDLAASTAVKVVHERLGIEKTPTALVLDSVPRYSDAQIVAPSTTLGGTFSQVTLPPEVVDVKRHRATKAEMEERARVKAEGDAAKARLMVVEDPLSGVPATSGTDAADLSEPLGLDPLAEPAEISNDELLKACEKVVAKKQDQLVVRKLIGQYAKQLPMIPQSRRQAFLDELAAI